MIRKIFFAVLCAVSFSTFAENGVPFSNIRGVGLVFVHGGLRRPWEQKFDQQLLELLTRMKKEAGKEFTMPELPELPDRGKLSAATGFWSGSLVMPYYHKSDMLGKIPSGTYGLRLSTFTPYMDDVLAGVHLSLSDDACAVYGVQYAAFQENADYLAGLQFAPLLAYISRTGGGLQGSLFFSAAEQFYGIQFGGISAYVKESCAVQIAVGGNFASLYGSGLQCSPVVNYADRFDGIQIAAFGNYTTGKIRGIQVGCFNRAAGGTVLQIGLLNSIDGAFLPWFPFVNFKF